MGSPLPMHTYSRHRDVPATAAQLHLLACHGQVGEPAAGLVGAVRALSGQVLGGDLGAQGLQLGLIIDLKGRDRRANCLARSRFARWNPDLQLGKHPARFGWRLPSAS